MLQLLTLICKQIFQCEVREYEVRNENWSFKYRASYRSWMVRVLNISCDKLVEITKSIWRSCSCCPFERKWKTHNSTKMHFRLRLLDDEQVQFSFRRPIGPLQQRIFRRAGLTSGSTTNVRDPVLAISHSAEVSYFWLIRLPMFWCWIFHLTPRAALILFLDSTFLLDVSVSSRGKFHKSPFCLSRSLDCLAAVISFTSEFTAPFVVPRESDLSLCCIAACCFLKIQ